MNAIPQAQIHGVDDLRLDTISPPLCGPDDVVVQVRECGICGSDLGYLAMGGLTGPDTPMPLGHELWGVVSEIGRNVTHVVAGDRVVVQPMSNGNNIGNGGAEGGFSPYLLVRNAGRLVSRDEIIDAVWGGRIVSESAISARIAAVRKAVGDDGKSQAIIRTVQRRGLQFVADFKEITEPAAEAVPTPQVRYASSDGGKSLAYTVTGIGPRLIRVPATPADIGMEWELPGLRGIVETISAEFELLRYDGFGFETWR